MKINEMKKGEVYIYTVDKKVPLVFTGKIVTEGNDSILSFKPVKTETNKNWFESLRKEITIRFNKRTGNEYVKPYKK